MDDTRHAGFSLLELLVTLSLAALLVSLAIPATGRLIDNSRLRSAAEQFSRELQLARNHALTHGRETRFVITAGATGWCYGWTDGASCDCHTSLPATTACSTGESVARRSHRQSSVDYPRTLIDGTSRTLRFSPIRGTASAASFQISNKYGELQVILSPLGRVRVCANRGALYLPC